ncbi:DEAD/DEAH box helicase [Thalassococcus sp. BH17M4-6]|uniref:DEAD/DEAH box helicase n=1 Tax=Thalassococcus sp. BH17M4-6 TaxID=3413148 RepID=UPI003BCF8FB3
MIQTLADALAEKGYDTLTPVQEAVTDPALQGRDMLVSAQTGSGKTVGFGLAIAETLLQGADRMGPAATPLALIVAPTRELAFQVMREITWLYARTGAVVATCVGGMDMRTEKRSLERGAHIVVGTPGRLRDHIQRGSLDLSGIRAVVLDEADEMLDLGFREDLEFMLGEAPADRRTLMFSATVPKMIATLAQTYQTDAARVNTTTGASQHADITYQALGVAQHDAEHAVINLLLFHDAQNAIVFANTRAMVARLTARLSNRGFAVVSLSGELSQTERTHALQAMRDGRARVCVATDVAARGIDLPNLDLVIHAELPSNSETLLHRSGRTGRAGRKGLSALIVLPKVRSKATRLLKFAKLQAEWTTPPSADDIAAREEERLLTDPAWSEAPSEAEAAFAAKLTAQFTPDQIAAAYLRLYQSRRSAPEDLSPPDAKPERKPREFGPSVWFKLSVGRNERAEPRWLLPLLCRAGNIDKDALGAIRIQESESYVEIATSAVDGFVSAVGPDGALEDGIRLTRLDAAPDLAPAPRRDAKPGKPRRPRPADDAPRAAPARTPRPTPAEPRPPRDEAVHSAITPKPAAKPAPKSERKPAKYEAKPWSAKDKGKPAAKGKGGGKPFGKPAGKDGKPSAKAAAPGKPKAKASDTSKRFTPPGKGAKKPAGRPGGHDAPRRKP